MNRKLSQNKIPRQQFQLRLNVRDPLSYNALVDPHANYYFVGKAAKQRLKQLKSQIKSARGWKSPQQQEMIQQIKDKIKYKFPKIKLPLLQGKEREEKRKQSDNVIRKKYTQQLVSARNSQLNQRQSIQSKTPASLSNNRTSIQKSKRLLSKKQTKSKVNHDDFMQFLAKKKQTLEQQPGQTQ